MSRSHHYPKLKPPPRPLFSCGIFGNCTNSPLSPTTPPSTTAATVPPPSPPPPATPPPPSSLSLPSDPPQTSSSSSSSSSTSQSFTQWRFPLHHPPNLPEPEPQAAAVPAAAAAASFANLADAFSAAELHFSYGEPLQALRILAASDSGVGGSACPPAVLAGVVAALRGATTARPAAKVLLALLLPEANRREAVAAGAATAAVETVAGASGPTAERALAALELMCTVPEGSAEVRGHALAAPVLAGAVEGMVGRGRECAIGVMAAIYGGEWAAVAPAEVARAVVVALQGECSARGRRKGAQLLRALQESGTVDLGADGY